MKQALIEYIQILDGNYIIRLFFGLDRTFSLQGANTKIILGLNIPNCLKKHPSSRK